VPILYTKNTNLKGPRATTKMTPSFMVVKPLWYVNELSTLKIYVYQLMIIHNLFFSNYNQITPIYIMKNVSYRFQESSTK